MKSPFLIAAAAIVLGFLLGWVAKPTPDAQGQNLTESSEPPARKRPSHADLIAPSERGKNQTSDPDAILAEIESGSPDPDLAKKHEAFSRLTGAKDRARLTRFAEALGLDDDQLAAVAELMSKHRGNAPDGAVLPDSIEGNAEFNETLDALLTKEQKDRLAAFKQRTVDSQVEAIAKQEAVRVLQTVDLSSEQRVAVEEAFVEKIRSSDPAEPDNWQLLSGTNTSRDSWGVNSGMRDLFSDPTVQISPDEFTRRMAEEQQKANDDRLDTIFEILTPAQIEQLKASDNARHEPAASIFGQSIRDPKFRR